MIKLDKLSPPQRVQLGCDPEFFLRKGGQIVGSERLIPEKGLRNYTNSYEPGTGNQVKHIPDSYYQGMMVRDGVQVEIHPEANACRAGIGMDLATAFRVLKKVSNGTGIEPDFNVTVEVSAEELASLSPACQVLGCMPSLNAYEPTKGLGVDPSTYRLRSAGGHIHMGLNTVYVQNKRGEYTLDGKNNYVKVVPDPTCLVPLLDILLGNTCVLLDRDPGNKIRREVYGRAGEFRLPSHGLEYRTLSNFWLRSWPLASFVLGMARFTTAVYIDEKARIDLLKRVEIPSIIRAINENDRDLALENFSAVRAWFGEHVADPVKEFSDYGEIPPLYPDALEDFDFFLSKPIEAWFPASPLNYWVETFKFKGDSMPGFPAYDTGHAGGWETFLRRDVRGARQIAQRKIEPPILVTPPSEPVLLVDPSVIEAMKEVRVEEYLG